MKNREKMEMFANRWTEKQLPPGHGVLKFGRSFSSELDYYKTRIISSENTIKETKTVSQKGGCLMETICEIKRFPSTAVL